MSKTVYLGRNSQRLGPYTLAQLTAMAGSGEIQPGDLAWYEGMDGWKPADEVLSGLGIAQRSAPPPLPFGQVPQMATAASTEGAPPTQKELYEAFVGPAQAHYYVPIFEAFDRGENPNAWHWPAAFVTQWWMLYRKMYLWGFLFYPILSFVVAFTLTLALSMVSQPLAGAGGFLSLVVSFVVMGLYSNKIYHGRARSFIERSGGMGLSDQQRRDWLVRKGGTSFLWLILVFFFGIMLTGILAAIAIPAYQDYVIRVQVSEGATLADGAKTAVTEYVVAHQGLPASNADAGLGEPAEIKGQYVESVQVENGLVVVTFGAGANRLIQGKALVYVPENTGNRLEWRCNTGQTTLANKYRPAVCRN